MPEGPSIKIVADQLAAFKLRTVISAQGNARIDMGRLAHKKIMDIKTWGKHLLLCFSDFTLRIHFLMFGTYLIDKTKATPLRLGLDFKSSQLNFYTCSVKFLEGKPDDHYDWSADVMNERWNPAKARKKLRLVPERMICDALLDQDIFSGVGNIIKNEVLFRVKIHPESTVGKLPAEKIKQMADEARTYSFEFLDWKLKGELKRNWLAHTKKICVRCDLPLIKKHTGIKKRRSFFCENCQKLYQ